MNTRRSIVLLAILAATLLPLGAPASALSCVRPHSDIDEITITGEIPAENWYWGVDVPVVIGRVIEATLGESLTEQGERLALVEVVLGLRLDAVPETVEIVAGPLASWGHPVYSVGDHVFLRMEEGDDLDTGIAKGACSSSGSHTEDEIESLIALADDYDVETVRPVPIVAETTTTTTTAPVTSTIPDGPVDDAVPIETAEPVVDEAADDGRPVLVGVVAVAGIVALAAAGYAAAKGRFGSIGVK